MSWNDVLKRVEGVIETALAKRPQEDVEIAPPPTHEEPQGSIALPDITEKIFDIFMAGMATGGSIPAGARPAKIKTKCPVCGQSREDLIIGGLSEAFLDCSGEFSEEDFQKSLICRRCGCGGWIIDDPKGLQRARDEWTKHAAKTGQKTRE